MSISGIISEFNPLHLGHEHIIKIAKKNNDKLICVMSGCFTERGEPALIHPLARAEAAIKAGADMVIELPVCYAVSDGERFAVGGVSIANQAGATSLTAGVEEEIPELIQHLADIKTYSGTELASIISSNIKKGLSYGKALTEALSSLSGLQYDNKLVTSFLNMPNNKLAVDYLYAIKKQNLDMRLNYVKRITCPPSTEIRKNFSKYRDYLPSYSLTITSEWLKEGYVRSEEFGAMILGALDSSDKDNISKCPDCSEGLENRIRNNAGRHTYLEEFVNEIVSARYTRARIKRLLIQVALGITKDMQRSLPAYSRVLAVKRDSLSLLDNPFLIKNSNDEKRLDEKSLEIFESEKRAYRLYSLSTHTDNMFYSKLLII